MVGLYFIPGKTMIWHWWTPWDGTSTTLVTSPVWAGFLGIFVGLICYWVYDGWIPELISLVSVLAFVVFAFFADGMGYFEAVPITLLLGSILCALVEKAPAPSPQRIVPLGVDQPDAKTSQGITTLQPTEPSPCPTCGTPMQHILWRQQATGRGFCIACFPTRGVCPSCGGRLPTDKAEQCLECHTSWRTTAPPREQADATGGAGDPTSVKGAPTYANGEPDRDGITEVKSTFTPEAFSYGQISCASCGQRFYGEVRADGTCPLCGGQPGASSQP